MNLSSIVNDLERMAKIADNFQNSKLLTSTIEEVNKYRDLKNDIILFTELIKRKYGQPEIRSETTVKYEEVPKKCELCNADSVLIRTPYKLNNIIENIYVCPMCRVSIIPDKPERPERPKIQLRSI